MKTINQITQTHLSVFVFDKANNNPIKRMPMYAEIAAIGKRIPEVIDANNINIIQDIFGDRDSKAWLIEALSKYLSISYFNQLNNIEKDNLIQTLVDKITTGMQAISNPTKAKQKFIVDVTVKAIVEELNIPKAEPEPEFETLSAYPLGMLATDHVGYLSYSLVNIPKNPFPMYNNLQFAVYLYPMGKEAGRIDALQQARITPDVILAKLEIEKPIFEANLKALNLPAMQNPDLADWYMSPGSFAALPSALIGADGCENLFPANFAVQEFRFRQVVRISDVPQGINIPSEYRFGYVDEYKVSLVPIGHSLGEIKYSLPLAPGESVKLAIIDWSRTDSTVRTEDTQFAEKLMHDTHRDRSITETVQSALNEWQRGGNVQGGVNASLFGIISIGGGGGYSTSSGSKELAAANTQKLSDSFSQASSALREFHSTVVVQSKQEEKQNIQTRTFSNYNHSHTLTILYYEILRHYKLVSEWVNRKAVALLPSDKINFTDDEIIAYRHILENNLLDNALKDGFDIVDKLQSQKKQRILNGVKDDAYLNSFDEGDILFSIFEIGLKSGKGINADKVPMNVPMTANEDIDSKLRARGGTIGKVDGFVVVTGGEHIPLKLYYEHPLNAPNVDIYNFNWDKRLFNTDFFNWFLVYLDRDIRWRDIIGFTLRNLSDNLQPLLDGTDMIGIDVNQDPWLLESISINGIVSNPDKIVSITEVKKAENRVIPLMNNIPIGALIMKNTAHSMTSILRPKLINENFVTSPEKGLSTEEFFTLSKLRNHLQKFNAFYNKLIYLNIDVNTTTEWFDTHKWGSAPSNQQNGQGPGNIIDHLEPIALEVFGTYIAYPLLQQTQNVANLSASTLQVKSKSEKLISLPTKGIFAEGKLGHCNISEEIDETRFWKWEEHPIPINATDINPINAVTPLPVQLNVQPTTMPNSTLNIQQPVAAPDPQGLTEALKVLATPNIFRDMSGREEVADLLKKLSDETISMAEAKNKAAEIQNKHGENLDKQQKDYELGLGNKTNSQLDKIVDKICETPNPNSTSAKIDDAKNAKEAAKDLSPENKRKVHDAATKKIVDALKPDKFFGINISANWGGYAAYGKMPNTVIDFKLNCGNAGQFPYPYQNTELQTGSVSLSGISRELNSGIIEISISPNGYHLPNMNRQSLQFPGKNIGGIIIPSVDVPISPTLLDKTQPVLDVTRTYSLPDDKKTMLISLVAKIMLIKKVPIKVTISSEAAASAELPVKIAGEVEEFVKVGVDISPKITGAVKVGASIEVTYELEFLGIESGLSLDVSYS